MALLCGYKMLINYNVFKDLLIQVGKIRKLAYCFSRHRRLNYVKCLTGCARIETMLVTARALCHFSCSRVEKLTLFGLAHTYSLHNVSCRSHGINSVNY